MTAQSLPPSASLKQLKRQAKGLVKAHGRTFGLQRAQQLIARDYGFTSWSRLKAALFDARWRDFLGAVRGNHVAQVRGLLNDFPEYASARVAGDCWTCDGENVARDADQSCLALHHGAVKGYAKIVELLLKHGADANARGWEGGRNYGMTVPIVLAAWEGNTDTMAALLRHGADPNVDDGAAMKTALRHRAYDKCRMLIDCGAAVDIDTASALGRHRELARLLKKVRGPVSLESAVMQNQVEAMRQLVAHGHVRDLDAPGWQGWTLVHVAAYYGAADALDYLIELGANINVNRPVCRHGWDVGGTALHIAAAGGMGSDDADRRILASLLRTGIDRSIRNAEGKTALELAGEKHNARKCTILGQGVNPGTDGLMALFSAIAAHDDQNTLRVLEASPEIAHQSIQIGASRQEPEKFYIKEIEHHVYAGDTALHIAAAAYAVEPSKRLLAKGANVRARNRRGAEPLHYAVDGIPGSPTWNPRAQATVVACLIAAGADPNAADKSGVAPLHRAVRTRCAGAVRALLEGGAGVCVKNKGGATALHLAVQNTGRGGTGAAAARDQQRKIILLLLKHGARPSDQDARGKSVKNSAVAGWILAILNA